jgi:[acyl-carrier-protein] S-malonyltransferase
VLAVLFPGQASQAVGMGTDLLAESVEARRLFELAESATGLPISRLCMEGPLERLTATDVAQPAVVVTSLAALAVLREKLGVEPAAVAGHSVGEYAAYIAAGVFDPKAGMQLVHLRAQAMLEACNRTDGGMAAVIGLDDEPLRAACAAVSQNGSSVEIANFNAPGNLIVSGARDALERVSASARAVGARRVLPLNVGGPFHSVYMRPAALALKHALDAVAFYRPDVPVVVNASADVTQDPEELRRELEVQLYSPVRWIETLHRLEALGCNRFLEVGPGQVLAGLVRRTLPSVGVKVASFGTLADLPAAESLVHG